MVELSLERKWQPLFLIPDPGGFFVETSDLAVSLLLGDLLLLMGCSVPRGL